MGVDLSTYRLRIGVFGPGRTKGATESRQSLNYSPYTSGPDIHFRLIVLFSVFIGTLLISTYLVQLIDSFATVCNQSPETLFETVCVVKIYNLQDTFPYSQSVTDIIPLCNERENTRYFELKLLIASDIELNPGPITDKDEILQAVYSSSEKLMVEIKNVKSEVSSLKTDVDVVRKDCAEVKSTLQLLERNQSKLERQVTDVETDVGQMKEDNNCLQLDIDTLNTIFDEKLDKIQRLDEDLDRLEANSRKENMRIFGLPEYENETDDLSLNQNITNNVLKVAYPEVSWNDDDIVDAYRIGERLDDQPKVTMVKFKSQTVKFKLYAKRELLRSCGIRISDDLTVRQREKLKDMKDRGNTGYFYKGELRVRPNTNERTNDRIQSRTFVSASRKLTQHSVRS